MSSWFQPFTSSISLSINRSLKIPQHRHLKRGTWNRTRGGSILSGPDGNRCIFAARNGIETERAYAGAGSNAPQELLKVRLWRAYLGVPCPPSKQLLASDRTLRRESLSQSSASVPWQSTRPSTPLSSLLPRLQLRSLGCRAFGTLWSHLRL